MLKQIRIELNGFKMIKFDSIFLDIISFRLAFGVKRIANPTDLASVANQKLQSGVELPIRQQLHDCNARKANCVPDALGRSGNTPLFEIRFSYEMDTVLRMN